jgi:hypothetical protein
MNKTQILGCLFAILMTAVLFTPPHTEIWRIPFFFGLLFGVFWYFKS